MHKEKRPQRRWPPVRQGERPQEKLNLPAAWSWPSSIQNCKEIILCWLSHPVCGLLLMAAQANWYTLWHSWCFGAKKGSLWQRGTSIPAQYTQLCSDNPKPFGGPYWVYAHTGWNWTSLSYWPTCCSTAFSTKLKVLHFQDSCWFLRIYVLSHLKLEEARICVDFLPPPRLEFIAF